MARDVHRAAQGEPLMYASPKRSALLSGLLHAAAIVLVLVVTKISPIPAPRFEAVSIVAHDIPAYLPPIRNTGGGGGGTQDLTPASRGVLPKRALRQFTPPEARILNDAPRLAMEPSIVAPPDIAMPAVLTTIGLPDGVLGPPSNGRGKGGGIGDGEGGGVGDRRGPGAGNGGDGGGVTGAGSAPLRGVITKAILQWKTEPEYSREAREARLQGMVVLRIEIDAAGRPQNIRVASGLGLGLDERAIDAVRQWRFRPALQNGRPIDSGAIVEVHFRLL